MTALHAALPFEHAGVAFGDQHVSPVAMEAVRDDLRAEPIGAEYAGGAMLFGRTEGDDDRARACEVVLDLGPGREVQRYGFFRWIRFPTLTKAIDNCL